MNSFYDSASLTILLDPCTAVMENLRLGTRTALTVHFCCCAVLCMSLSIHFLSVFLCRCHILFFVKSFPPFVYHPFVTIWSFNTFYH